MEKKKIEVHAVTIHIYTIIIAVLALLLAVVGLKYLHLKFAVHGFTEGAMMLNASQRPMGTIGDYGAIVATTVANYPQGSTLLTQPTALQNYVTMLSKQLQRDIVVIDPSRKILADTIASNIGTNYSSDMFHEIDQTLKDGVSRTFIEKSADYPMGIIETVVSMKNSSNQIIGVVLVSSTTISK